MSRSHPPRAATRQGKRLARIGLPLLIMLAMILPNVVMAAPANPAPAPAPAESAPAAASASAPLAQPEGGTITGTVFRDYNANGSQQTWASSGNTFNEPGIPGVVVTAYDSSGAPQGTTTSGATGFYTLAATGTGPYRIEFTLPTNGSLNFLQEGATSNAAGQNTNVQFVPNGSSNNINHGFNNPIDFSQDAPDLITPITFVGPRSSAIRDESIVGIGYNASGDLSAPGSHTTYAQISKTGTLYGMIFQRKSRLILAGTYLKAYADIGPVQGGGGWLAGVDPMGAIYASESDEPLPNSAVYANLNKIMDPTVNQPLTCTLANPATCIFIPGNPAGVDPRQTSPYNYASNACPSPGTTTPTTPTSGDCWNHDPASWEYIGLRGLGDLEEDDNEQFVFVVNLGDQKLYQLPIVDDPSSWPIRTLAAPPVAIPNTCANPADAVPGALGFQDGKLYVGVTCTAKSSQNRADLDAQVWEFNPQTQTFGALPVFTMDLNYTRGCIWTGVTTTTPAAGWFGSNDSKSKLNTPWTNCQTYLNGSSNDFHNVTWNAWPTSWQMHYEGNKGINGPGKPGWTFGNNVQIEYPHPWLSDIAFDGNDILLGFRDINGDRTGNNVRSPNITAAPPPTSGTPQTNWISQYAYEQDGAGFGDLLRACWNGAGWTLESNGVCGGLTALNGQDRGQGPGPGNVNPNDGSTGWGEFYWDDSGPGSRNPDAAMKSTWAYQDWSERNNPAHNDGYFGHEETLKGGLFQRAGAPDIAVTQADQLDSGDGGIARFSQVPNHSLINDPYPGLRNPDRVGTGFGNNEIGIALRHTALYGNLDGFFGKANGLGDVEALLDAAPIEIGNRVWRDTTINGRQDPGEAVLANVVVELWKDTNNDGTADTKVAQDTTDATGNYLFSFNGNANNPGEDWSFTPGNKKVLPDTTYEVRILRTQSALSGVSAPTLANADADIRDSDGVAIADTGGPGGRSITGVRLTTGGPGVNNHDLDFGFIANADLVSLGNQVWYDLNNNGVIDGGEQGINGVVVNLYADSNGDGRYTPGVDTFITTQNTSGSGNYLFTGLLPGDYVVQLPQSNFVGAGALAGMASSTGNNPTPDPDDDTDNDDNGYHIPGNGVASLAVTLLSNTEPGPPDNDTNPTVDFGFFGLGAIGNYVWVDENSDGFQDEGEPGIPNVQVNLYTSAGVFVATTYTDSHGGYLFDNLKPGSYLVDVEDGTGNTSYSLPFFGMTQTPPPTLANADFGNQAHNTPIPSTSFTGYPVTIGGAAPLENLTADFGYNYRPENEVNGGTGLAALGDRVWIDTNGNGAQDPSEVGVSGVELTLYRPGPDGIFGTGDDVTYGNSLTDVFGTYMFNYLPPGAYVVKVTSDAGASHAILTGGQYDQTGDPDHFGVPGTGVPADIDNTTTTPVLLGPGDVFLNADFGYQPTAAELGSIGDTIWFDANANGTGPALPDVPSFGQPIGLPVTQGNQANSADANEYGIPGVTVVLIRDLNGDGQWDASDPIIATDTTDENGQYLFEDLPIGNDADYLVWVNDTNNVLGEMVPTYDQDGASAPAAGLKTGLGISAVPNLTAVPVRDQDFGYTNTYQQLNPQNPVQPLGLIGDYVWFDSDRDNVQDGNETGVEGVVVELLNSTGTAVIATTVTDENGHYSFGGLPLNNSYIINIPASNFGPGQPLEGTTNTGGPSGGSGNTGPVVSLTPGSPINLVQDFGYAAPTNAQGSIGNQVWEDLNADGIRQPGEPAIAGVTVDLYRDLNGNGMVDPGEPLMGTRTTDANGQYLFSALPIVGGGDADPEAEYVVDVTDVNGVLAGYWHSLSPNQDPNTGVSGNTANDALDNSKTDPFAVEIGSGTGGQPVSNNLNVDFGYYVKPAAVGNFVWIDSNGNGIQDSGEPGIDDVTIEMRIEYPDGTIHSVYTVTGDDPSTAVVEQGWYSFGNLLLDEDYRQSSSTTTPQPNQPSYVIVSPPDVLTVGATTYNLTAPNQGANDMVDSDNEPGADETASSATQGSNNVAQDANAGNESNPNAGYDFGYAIPMDLGDLPDNPYPTNVANNGARHQLTSPLKLGATVDAEYNGQPNGTATGDDNDATTNIASLPGNTGDDEDGVLQSAGVGGGWKEGTVAGGLGGALFVQISGGSGVPQVFMDFGSGLQAVSLLTNAGAPAVPGALAAGNYTFYFDLPTGICPTAGNSIISTRVRLSAAGGLAATGLAPDGEVEDYIFQCSDAPLAVVLADFNAAAQTDHILVSWETVSELDNAGFNLYRSATDAAPEQLLANVASQVPGSAQGAFYSYQDFAVEAGQSYYYWLETVDLNGGTSLNGPVNAVAQSPTAVTLSNVAADSGATTNLLWLLVVAAGLALAALYGLRRSAARR